MSFRRVKEWVVAALFGGCVVGALIFYFTSTDKGLVKAKENRDIITKESKVARQIDKRIVKKIKKEKKQFKKIKRKHKRKIVKIETLAQKHIKKAEYIAALEQEIVKRDKYIFVLEHKVTDLDNHNSLLIERLQYSHIIQDKQLGQINSNIRVITAVTAQNKALKIGVGVGITLAVVGGAIGGFYGGKLLSR